MTLRELDKKLKEEKFWGEMVAKYQNGELVWYQLRPTKIITLDKQEN